MVAMAHIMAAMLEGQHQLARHLGVERGRRDPVMHGRMGKTGGRVELVGGWAYF